MVLIFSALVVAFFKQPETPVDPRTLPPSSPIPEGAITEVFQSGPYLIEAPVVSNSSMWMKVMNNIDRPAGDIAIHRIYFSTRDQDDNLLPQSILYNHHAFIQEADTDNVLSGFGAEGVESFLSIPTPYARLVRANSRWLLNVHYVSVWQYASGAPLNIKINYTIVYSKLDSNGDGEVSDEEANKWIDVDYDIIGIDLRNKAEFDVPGNGGKNSSYCRTYTKTARQNETLVYAQGHIHIGGINITYSDKTLNTTIVEALPVYDDCGFITRIGGGHPIYPLIAGHVYEIQACYDNSRYYKGVMGLFQCYYSDEKRGFASRKQRTRNVDSMKEYFL